MSTTLCSLVAKNSLRMILVEKRFFHKNSSKLRFFLPIFSQRVIRHSQHTMFSFRFFVESRIEKKEREKNNSRDSIL